VTSLDIKAGSAVVALVAAVGVVFQGIPAPEGVWPVTVAGWVAVVAAVAALATVIVRAIRNPVHKVFAEMRERVEDRIKLVEKNAANSQEALSMRLDETRGSVRSWEDRQRALETNVTTILADARHVMRQMDEWKEMITKWREEDRASDDRILEALTRLRGSGGGGRDQ
jgi:hypothetical protein